MITYTVSSVLAIQATLSDDQVASYHKEGYLIIPGLLDQASARALRDEVMGIMDAIGLLAKDNIRTNKTLDEMSKHIIAMDARLDAIKSAQGHTAEHLRDARQLATSRHVPVTTTVLPGGVSGRTVLPAGRRADGALSASQESFPRTEAHRRPASLLIKVGTMTTRRTKSYK